MELILKLGTLGKKMKKKIGIVYTFCRFPEYGITTSQGLTNKFVVDSHNTSYNMVANFGGL